MKDIFYLVILVFLTSCGTSFLIRLLLQVPDHRFEVAVLSKQEFVEHQQQEH